MSALGRKIRRQRAKELMHKMKIKKRAIQIMLSDNLTMVSVHSPSMEQFTEYLDSFTVIGQIGAAFQAVQQTQGGILNNLSATRIDKPMLEQFYPLLAVLSSYRELKTSLADRDMSVLTDMDFVASAAPLTTDEYKGLSIDDGLGVMLAYVKLLSPESLTNPTSAEATPVDIPQTAVV
jgi:hypothetical protein